MGLVPLETRYSFRKGDQGIVIWAIQKALDSLAGYKLATDGDFGPNTEQAVKVFQYQNLLLADGIFGPASSAALALALESRVTVPLPDGILRGLVSGESGDHIGAVNWSVPGGVDCSYVQRRVLERDYNDQAVVHRAFNAPYQMKLFARGLRAHHDTYISRGNANELAWRLALLYHNYPYAADKISRVGVSGLSSYFRTPQGWVRNIGAKFPDDVPIETPLEWCQHYALGAASHNDPGFMARFVESWA